MSGVNVMINPTTAHGIPVVAKNVQLTFFPTGKLVGTEKRCMFVRFEFDYRRGQEAQGYTYTRRFVAKLADRILVDGIYKLDLIITGDPSDGSVSLIVEGARGTHSPDIKVSHAKENGQESELYADEGCV